MADRHPRLADLAVSFPALLAALARPRPRFDPQPAIDRAVGGAPLADIARAAGVPLWLRRFVPEAVPQAIPELPDGELFRRMIANHLPRSPRLAPTWLQAVANAATWAEDAVAVWTAREVVRDPKGVVLARLRLISLWAWFSLRPATDAHRLIRSAWSPAMRFRTALDAANDWRVNVALRVDLGDGPIADVWLQPGTVDGYEFLPLRTISDLTEEAQAMRNCVRTYGYQLAHNRARLWSVRKDGARVATMRIARRGPDPLLQIAELRAAGNAKVSADVWWAARRWLQAHDLPRVDNAPIAGIAPDRRVWLSLWRPYWLVKRHVPEWLPLAPSFDALDDL